MGSTVGARWHDLPDRYGKWKTVHKRFTRWAEAGVWERVFERLIEDPDNSYVSLDSSLVRAPTGGDGQRLKRGVSQWSAIGPRDNGERLWGVPEGV